MQNSVLLEEASMTQKLMVSKLYLTESLPTHPLSLHPSAMFISFSWQLGNFLTFPLQLGDMSWSCCTGTITGTHQGPQLCTPTLLTPALTIFPLLPFPSKCGTLLPGVSSLMSTSPCFVYFLHQIYTCPASRQTPQPTLCLRPPVFTLSGI